MKNNKGFTLVELLAVIGILLLIVTIITPKVIKQLKSSEQIAYDTQIEELINISKMYMSKNPELLPDNEYVISFEELKEAKLLSTEKVLDPRTEEELEGCILVKYQNNKYQYSYIEDEKCEQE